MLERTKSGTHKLYLSIHGQGIRRLFHTAVGFTDGILDRVVSHFMQHTVLILNFSTLHFYLPEAFISLSVSFIG
jgi:hypothetical protein